MASVILRKIISETKWTVFTIACLLSGSVYGGVFGGRVALSEVTYKEYENGDTLITESGNLPEFYLDYSRNAHSPFYYLFQYRYANARLDYNGQTQTGQALKTQTNYKEHGFGVVFQYDYTFTDFVVTPLFGVSIEQQSRDILATQTTRAMGIQTRWLQWRAGLRGQWQFHPVWRLEFMGYYRFSKHGKVELDLSSISAGKAQADRNDGKGSLGEICLTASHALWQYQIGVATSRWQWQPSEALVFRQPVERIFQEPKSTRYETSIFIAAHWQF